MPSSARPRAAARPRTTMRRATAAAGSGLRRNRCRTASPVLERAMANSKRFLTGRRIDPRPIRPDISVADLIDTTFLAYNAGRLNEACRLFTEKMLEEDVTVGVSLTGALTPTGLGIAALIPLIEAGFIDWIVSTGANLYHDAHFALGLEMRQGNPFVSDVELRNEEVVRIYDIFFDYTVLLDTDSFFRQILRGEEFQRPMSTAEFHYLVGGSLLERERALGLSRRSLLATCHEYEAPGDTSSPRAASIGMNVAALELQGPRLAFAVTEAASIVLDAKRRGGKPAVVIFGGGSPKNFMLRTEPQIQEVLGIEERGHDYFLQITDARPDTGGLSGATPAEAVSWGKVDPDRLPDAVVCYTDSTIGLPVLAAYALAARAPREPKRLYRRRAEMMDRLMREYAKSARNEAARERARHGEE